MRYDGAVKDDPPPCPKCGGPRYRYKKSGPRCKACLAAKARARYQSDPEKAAARVRESYRRNPEAARQRAREEYQRNAEAIRQRQRDAYWADPEAARAKMRAVYAADREAWVARGRAWRTANPDKVAAANKRWHQANPDRVAELNREYYEQNRGSEIARSLAYTKAHPEVDAAIKHRRNARKRATVCEHGDGCVTSSFVAELRSMPCWYCGGPMREIDHFVPLARGGLHCRGNLVPACKPCNNSKHAQDPEKWLARRRRERVA